jgi:hypothetical protein
MLGHAPALLSPTTFTTVALRRRRSLQCMFLCPFVNISCSNSLYVSIDDDTNQSAHIVRFLPVWDGDVLRKASLAKLPDAKEPVF